MTILVAHSGVLYADSGRVSNYNRWYAQLDDQADKIFISPCKRAAICSTGFVNTKDDLARIGQFFVGRIAAYLASKDFKDLDITVPQRKEVGLADCVYLIMTTHGVYQYDAGSWAIGMTFCEPNETVVLGGAVHIVNMAMRMGLGPVEAMELACDKNIHCRRPIKHFNLSDLQPFDNIVVDIEAAPKQEAAE